MVASIRDTGDLLTPLQRRLQRIVCRLADCVLVNAEAIRRNLLEQGYDASNIVVIRNGIRLSKSTGQGRGATLRRELGIPLVAPLVVVFSRLNRMKGVQYFLDAAILLLQKFPEACFLVAGDGGSRKELEERAYALGLGHRIVFTGFRSDVPDLLIGSCGLRAPVLERGHFEYPARIHGCGCPRDRHRGGRQSGSHR